MKKVFKNLLILSVMAVFVGTVHGEASLWLFPDSALPGALTDDYNQDPTYVGADQDPWLSESYVISEDGFILDVYNHGRGAGDNTAYSVQLIVAVEALEEFYSATIDGVSLTPASFTYGTPSYSCSGRNIPYHGVFPTYNTTIDLGDIAQDEIRQVSVEVSGTENLRVHFDAYGEGYTTRTRGKKITTRCYDVFNPFSHDVTLLGTGGQEPTPVPCVYDLDIVKTGPASISAGETIIYTIDYSSGESTCDQNNVVITDTLPTFSIAGMTLPALHVVSTVCTCGTDVCTASDDDLSINCNIGVLAVGDYGTVTVEAVVSPLIPGGTVLTNGVCIDSAEADEVCDYVDTTVELPPPPQNDAGNDIGTPGFWCNQLQRSQACADSPDLCCVPNGDPGLCSSDGYQKFSYNEVTTWLTMIQWFSRVFDELGFGVNLGDAITLICGSDSDPTVMSIKLQRHLLTLWYNLTSNQVYSGTTLGSLCGYGLPSCASSIGVDLDWTVGDVMVTAESALLAPDDDITLECWKNVIDAINNAQAPGAGDCPL